MRLVLLAFCALLLLCLAGCGSSLDKGPTTRVEIMHIQATLPGSDWHKASHAKVGVLDTERWENANGTLFFRVATDPDEALNYPPVVDSVHVAQYMTLMGYPPSTQVVGGTIMGRYALLIESVSPGDADYRTQDYACIVGLRHYYVGAGASNSTWDTGGADYVFDIINSVKVAIDK